MSKHGLRAFTLIELLIVVAIIAILAAIAVPNFLEAQTRAKVSRSLADIRTLATAIESYAVDNNKYPIDGHGPPNDGQAYWYVPGGPTAGGGAGGVTSPIAYISSNRLIDPFRSAANAAAARAADTPDGQYFEDSDYQRYRYRNGRYTYLEHLGNQPLTAAFEDAYGLWQLVGNGPDRVYGPTAIPTGGSLGLNIIYDPTNGTVSSGDLVRSQKESAQRQR